jgi:speckle-type POZ protein
LSVVKKMEPNVIHSTEALDPSSNLMAANSSQTEIKVEFLKHNWTVKNFSHCYQEYLENYVHLPRGEDTLTWSIKIYPKGNGENNKDFVFLCLNRVLNQSIKAHKVGFRSRFYLKNFENKEIECRIHPNPSHSDYVSYIKRDVLFPQIQPHDSITVFVEIDVAVETITTNVGELLPPLANCEKVLSSNMLSLLEDEKHTDFKIRAGKMEFKVHKSILAARSPVFCAMLTHENTEESRTGIMNITDVDGPVIKEMLKYIYSGYYSEEHDLAEDLLIAADKYRLDELKQHCERTLMKGIKFDNACQLLILGDIYCAKNLKENAVRFIQRHPSDITTTEGWQAILRDHNALVTDIVRSFDKSLPSIIGPEKPTVPSSSLPSSSTPQI